MTPPDIASPSSPGGTIAGIGCRAATPAQDIADLVRRAEAASGCCVTALAAPLGKRADIAAAAALLCLPLLAIDDDALAAAQPRCLTRSPAALRARGVASVAEGCALAAAGPQSRLILPRIASARATCAIAAA